VFISNDWKYLFFQKKNESETVNGHAGRKPCRLRYPVSIEKYNEFERDKAAEAALENSPAKREV